jgi:hypothetical protein
MPDPTVTLASWSTEARRAAASAQAPAFGAAVDEPAEVAVADAVVTDADAVTELPPADDWPPPALQAASARARLPTTNAFAIDLTRIIGCIALRLPPR